MRIIRFIDFRKPALVVQLLAAFIAVFSNSLVEADSCCYGVTNVEVTQTIIAGTGTATANGDGELATHADIQDTRGLWIDSNDNVYFTDYTNHVVRRVNSAGIINRFAGNVGNNSFGGDGEDALSSSVYFSGPWDLTGDTANNIYITDYNNRRVRMVSSSDNIITTLAGNGEQTFPLEPVALIEAGLGNPIGIDIDPSNQYLFVAGYSMCVVWRLDLVAQVAEIYGGTGSCGVPATGVAAAVTSLGNPFVIWVDPTDGDVFFGESDVYKYYKIDTGGILYHFAGNGTSTYSEGSSATASSFTQTYAVTGDSLGNVYLAGYSDNRVRKVCQSTGEIEVLFGTGSSSVLGLLASMYFHSSSNSIYYGDLSNNFVKKILIDGSMAADPEIIVGQFGSAGSSIDGVDATSAFIGVVRGVWVDSVGQIYYGDGSSNIVYMIDTAGIVNSIFTLGNPWALAGDSTGNVYVADSANRRVYQISTSTLEVNIFAGNGEMELSGDGGDATSAGIYNALGLAADQDNLYIASSGYCSVRRVSFATNIISTFAGTGSCGDGNDNVTASSNPMRSVYGLWMDTATNQLFIAEYGANKIRSIDGNGIISTFAGDGGSCCSTAGGLATQSSIGSVYGVTGDSFGKIYFSPFNSYRLFMVDRWDGILQSLAGNGFPSYVGNIYYPFIHANERLFYGDATNYVISSICINSSIVVPVLSPTTSIPTTTVSTSTVLTTAIPTSFPSTMVPTMVMPSTVGPSTAEPTLTLPSTAAPTTAVPSVSVPTTSIPTTVIPSTSLPTSQPSDDPSVAPTCVPSNCPTVQPSSRPTAKPIGIPTARPTTVPLSQPSSVPTITPSSIPTGNPTTYPSMQPTAIPSASPIAEPSSLPSSNPSPRPSNTPTNTPTSQPSIFPSANPTAIPTIQPSSRPTESPSSIPSTQPTYHPSSVPSTQPSSRPSCGPTSLPTFQPSDEPTANPSVLPTSQPSIIPSCTPSSTPTSLPSYGPTVIPSCAPTAQPSIKPSTNPSSYPSPCPSTQPSAGPTSRPSGRPSSCPSAYPTGQPSSIPSRQPSDSPTAQPSNLPTYQPSNQPSALPSSQPTIVPSMQPSVNPTAQPSSIPSRQPSDSPTAQPSNLPSYRPSNQPSALPSSQPTSVPSMQPSVNPTAQPSSIPSRQPSDSPTAQPSNLPTYQPSNQPTLFPSSQPTQQPSCDPSSQPSVSPTIQPSAVPTMQPFAKPTALPTVSPSTQPSFQPSSDPSSQPSSTPSDQPSPFPSSSPSEQPTKCPTSKPTSWPSSCPTSSPSGQPSLMPSTQPLTQPSSLPSSQPFSLPSKQPSMQPTMEPTSQPSGQPSQTPSIQPTSFPSIQPSAFPSTQPSTYPTAQPAGMPSASPTLQPSSQPSNQPSGVPTLQPSEFPTARPSTQPSDCPTSQPTTQPSGEPSSQPSGQPSLQPTSVPTAVPSGQPSISPSMRPTMQPSSLPIARPSYSPSGCPTSIPSGQPSINPSGQPTWKPSATPSTTPSFQPSSQPTTSPSSHPTSPPSTQPSSVPSTLPSSMPSSEPSSIPSVRPSIDPSGQPTGLPTQFPSAFPSSLPSNQPSRQPTSKPSSVPSSVPTSDPSGVPTQQPSSVPSTAPTGYPSVVPTVQPVGIPTVQPTVQPSTQPLSSPTQSPTIAPSASPSSCPSSHPSAEPSSVPTIQYTQLPSLQPSAAPTCVPSSQPTSKPSSGPSSDPSSQPSEVPSAIPSSQPTSLPTLTVGNTHRPTQKPSFVPTYSEVDLWQRKLDELLEVVSAVGSSRAVERTMYFELTVPSSSVLPLHGGCESWSSLIYSTVPSSAISYAVDHVAMERVTSLTEEVSSSSLLICGDSDQANAIVDALMTVSNEESVTMVEVICNDNVWVIKQCSGLVSTPAVCVDCEDPCIVREECGMVMNSSAVFLDPCSVNDCSLEVISAPSIELLSIGWKEIEDAPSFVNIELNNTTKSSILLELKLSGPGTINCAAYDLAEVEDATDGSYIPSSTVEILLQGYSAIVDHQNRSSLELQGLDAATRYLVYCMSISPVGVEMRLEEALTTGVEVRTSCCLAVDVKISAPFAMDGERLSDYMSIELAGQPRHDLRVRILVFTLSGDVEEEVVPNPFFPSSFIVKARSEGGQVLLQSSLKGLPAGVFSYIIELDGVGASRFEVLYSSGTNHIDVLAAEEPPPAPVLTSAVFSSDGSYIIISFDANTDRGGLSNRFSCDELLDFTCASTSSCRWSSGARIDAFVDRQDGCASIGSSVALQNNATVRAPCITSGSVENGCDIDGWPISPPSIVHEVKGPTVPELPSISIAAPETVGECDAVMLDISGSTGSGGRPWLRSVISVDTQASRNVTHLRGLLKQVTNVNLPITIPSSLLQAGFSYNFKVELCNFVGGCSQGNRRVSIVSNVIPTVTLPGQALRVMQTSGVFRVTSNAHVASCFGGLQRYTLTYDWEIFHEGVQILSIENESRDPSKLRLGSFQLDVGRLYVIQLKVTIAENLLSSTAKLQVLVEQGDLQLVIRGGRTRTVRVEENVIIDASQSYDEDVQTLVGKAAGLSYSWQCIQTFPSFNDTCSNVLSFGDLATEAEIFVGVALANAVGAEARITVTLLDDNKERSAESSVSVTILEAISPAVDVESNLVASGVMNSGKQLTLRGIVSFPVGFNGTSTWSVDDASLDLSMIVRSPIMHSHAALDTPSAREVYLVIRPNSLPAGFTYTFQLGVNIPFNDASALATVLVTVNSPPLIGSFVVDPSSGKALIDQFRFIAAEWTDPDLPLLYQFGYVTAGDEYLVLSSKSQSAFSVSPLPAGLESDDHEILCGVEVFDAYVAPSSAVFATTVTPDEVFNASETQKYISDLLVEGSATADGIKQANALGSYLLNIVNCSLAPNCSALNRVGCYRTDHTCGDCVSSAYVGRDGDANEACELIVGFDASFGRRLSESCASNDECAGFLICQEGFCVEQMKSCKGDCSGHGQCMYVDVSTGEDVELCGVGSHSCEAVCDCEAVYVGSDSCSVSTEELLEKQNSRTSIVNSILSLMELEEADEQTMAGWLNSLQAVSQAPDELSEEAISGLLAASERLLSNAASVELDTEVLLVLLKTIDVAMQAISHGTRRRRRLMQANMLRIDGYEELRSLNRLLEDGAYFNSTVIGKSLQFLEDYGKFIGDRLLPGQDAVQVTQSQLRLYVQMISSTDLARGTQLSLQLPQSRLEEVQGESSQMVRVSVDESGAVNTSSLRVSISSFAPLHVLDSESDESTTQYFSEVTSLTLSETPCSSSDCNIEIVLQISPVLAEKIAEYDGASDGTSFVTNCDGDDGTVYSYTCPDGNEIRVSCNGEEGERTTVCPDTTLIPVCNMVMDGESMDSGCTLVSYTANSITCSCPFLESRRRRLQDGDDGSSDESDEEYSVSYVAMLEEVQESFVSTVESADDLSSSSAKDSWVAIVTVGVFTLFVVIALGWSHYTDSRVTLNQSISNESESKLRGSRLSRSMSFTASLSKKGNSSHRMKRRVVKNTPIKDPNLLMAEEALPQILSSRSLFHRVRDEMKSRHRWFGIYYHYSVHFPRVLRVLSLTTNVVVMLFIQSLTYTLTNPDDGECERLKSRKTCLAEESAYATGESKCSWDGKKCSFIEPDSDVKVILFVAVFSAILATPLSLLADWIIMSILSAQTKEEKQDGAVLQTGSGQDVDDAFVAVSKVEPDTGTHWNRAKRLVEALRKPSNGSFRTMNFKLLAAKEEFNALKSKLQHYRNELTNQERHEFDLLWGLSENGEFRGVDVGKRFNLIESLRKVLFSKYDDADVGNRILMDLVAVRSAVEEERKRLHEEELHIGDSDAVTQKEKSKRLLYLFQCDLLPGVSGKILEAKGQRDFAVVASVPYWMKISGWAFIVLLNVSMLFYILLFAMTQTSSRQGAWAQSFMIWLVMEIFLVSSLVVILMHVMLPSIILKDVTKIKQRLMENIRDFNRNVKKRALLVTSGASLGGNDTAGSEESGFNAAEYLFVSTRVAKEHTYLRESQMILEFKTPWPKQSYQHVANVSKAYSKKFTALTRSMSILLIFVITTFLGVPPVVQDIFLEIASTAVVGYAMLLHLELFYIFPLLAFFPLMMIAIVVHFVLRASKVDAQMRLKKLLEDDQADVASIHPREHENERNDKNDERKSLFVDEVGSRGDSSSSDESEEQSSGGESESGSNTFHRAVHHFEGRNDYDSETESDDESEVDNLHMRRGRGKHVNRRRSVRQGINIARRIQASLEDNKCDDATELSDEFDNRNGCYGIEDRSYSGDNSGSDGSSIDIEMKRSRRHDDRMHESTSSDDSDDEGSESCDSRSGSESSDESSGSSSCIDSNSRSSTKSECDIDDNNGSVSHENSLVMTDQVIQDLGDSLDEENVMSQSSLINEIAPSPSKVDEERFASTTGDDVNMVKSEAANEIPLQSWNIVNTRSIRSYSLEDNMKHEESQGGARTRSFRSQSMEDCTRQEESKHASHRSLLLTDSVVRIDESSQGQREIREIPSCFGDLNRYDATVVSEAIGVESSGLEAEEGPTSDVSTIISGVSKVGSDVSAPSPSMSSASEAACDSRLDHELRNHVTVDGSNALEIYRSEVTTSSAVESDTDTYSMPSDGDSENDD